MQPHRREILIGVARYALEQTRETAEGSSAHVVGLGGHRSRAQSKMPECDKPPLTAGDPHSDGGADTRCGACSPFLI